ncbi:MAG TPA: transporter substrate-binding domain-containing protein, partial [Methylophilus sp.]
MQRILCALFCMVTAFASHAETITLVAEDDWAPYSSMKPDKSGPQGLTPELIKQAFKQKGIEVKYLTLPFARCMYLSLIGKYVGCFDATITLDNKDRYYWHKTPLFVEGVSVFAHAKAKVKDVKVSDMEGKTVG